MGDHWERLQRLHGEGSIVLVGPTLGDVNTGVAVFEAAAANVPVVGTRVGFVSDWDGAAAVAVPPGDPARLAAAIVQLLENPQRRHAIAHVAREWVERHDADHTATAMTELYRSLR